MITAKKIRSKIKKIQKGKLFSYSTLKIKPNELPAATKAIQKLIQNGDIERSSKGIFYKPKKSVFGSIKPTDSELIKQYLYKNDKRISYISGNTLYNRLGLATQVPNVKTIAVFGSRKTTHVGNLNIKSVKAYVMPTESNIKYIEILDLIKDLKRIPDLEIKDGIDFLKAKIKDLDSQKIIKYALEYPPRVPALLGALLELDGINTDRLKQQLNPLSTFTFGLSTQILPNMSNWNLK